MKIEGSIALVTGANRGLGRALVAQLLDAGAAKVYAAARDEKKVSTDDPRVVPIALDITKPESASAAAGKASDVTLLVNNAGSLTAYNLLKATQAELDADFQTNVYGTLNVARAFVPLLDRLARSNGPSAAAVVNILSIAALASLPAIGGYSASKAAAYSITQALRAELRAKRIEVLAVLPALVDTDMVRHLPMPKTSADETAKGIIAGIARGDEEIFPDARAQQWGALWNKSHKNYERTLASL